MTDDYKKGYEDGFAKAQLRCHDAVNSLEERWRKSAIRYRTDGLVKPWWGKPYVLPKWEASATTIDAAVKGLTAIRMIIMQFKPKFEK